MSKKGRFSILGEIEEYCRAIERIKPMTREEEVVCATAFKETGDQRYACRLVEANLIFVLRFVLARFGHTAFSLSDLVQEGNRGLAMAVKRFDVSRGNRFITYAMWLVQARVKEYLIEISRFHENETSMDQPAYAGEDDRVSQLEKSLSLFGIAQQDDPVEDFLAAETVFFEEERVGFALNTLTDLERLIVRRRFLRPRKWLLKEIGDEVGYTKERIRQLQNGALEKLRKYFINEPYKGGEKEG